MLVSDTVMGIVSRGKAKLKTEFLEGFKDKKVEPKRSWANVVDDIVNSGQFQCWNDKENSFSEAEIEIEPFDDFLERKWKRNKKKAKKFGSLLEIQNKILTESERRKRDRALKRRNWSKHLLEESELSGKSLSDIDISNRVSNLVKEAKQCPWGFSRFGSKLGSIFNLDFKWISKEEAGNFRSSLYVRRDARGGIES
ncbi:hypothetical protein V6N13_033108 [Hibiscus sabdariffa]